MADPLNNRKFSKSASQDSKAMQPQTLTKKIPRHRRPKYEIEPDDASYRRINMKQNLGRRLNFHTFCPYPKNTFHQEVAHISKILKTSSKIAEKVIFPVGTREDVNNKMVLRFSKEIKKMQCLKVFDFYTWACAEITEFGLKNMTVGFKTLKSLRHLSIQLGESECINDRGIIFVAKGLKKLISLQTLDLRFDEGAGVTDESLKPLFKNLKYLRNLQTLNISFHYSGGLCWEEIGDPAKELKGLKSLKNLHLNCSLNEEMTPVGIKKISKMLEVLKGLENITLRLLECNVRDKDVKILMKGFKGKESLKKIKLGLARNYLTDKGLAMINACFQKLEVIEEIELSVNHSEKKVTQGASQQLEKNLAGIASLKQLKVNWKKEYN